MVYNGIAAMAAIDNLSQITFTFVGEDFFLRRDQIELVLGKPLDALLEKEIWLERVQEPLHSPDFARQFLM